MSRREATLCDHNVGRIGPHGEMQPFPCDNLSIGVCIACNRDVCTEHTRHKNGALRIKLVIMQGPDPQGPERVAHEAQNTAVLCWSCERALMKTSTYDVVERIGAAAHEIIRAALAAQALT